MSSVLVVNSGSSSFKYQLIEMDGERRLATGLIERIGDGAGRAVHTVVTGGEYQTTERELEIRDHTHGFSVMLDAFREHGPSLTAHPPVAVGHRVVHGGKRFFEPTVITDLVVINIEDLAELAPLHNPANVQGIQAARRVFADIPHVAVFDTAFHRTLPPRAYTYALDAEVAERFRIRRYGFHGTSHKFVSEAVAAYLDRPLADLNQLVLHLGNGASITAVSGGASVETSMGFTPLEGLVMGTRTGDIDPAVMVHLQRHARLSVDEVDELFNRRSGLLGLSGVGDMRDLQRRRAEGDAAAARALDVYVHRLKGYVGNYYAQLGRVDVISFTAGVGENNPLVRRESLSGLGRLGIEIDDELNEAPGHGIRRISTGASEVAVLVVPTDEELEIARQSLAAIG